MQLEAFKSKTIIAKSQIFKNIVKKALKIARVDANVIIFGESGTGKDVIAEVIPSLRNRQECIMPLILHYLKYFSNKYQIKGTLSLTDNTSEALEKYTYPGNIRELINMCERLVVMNENSKISRKDFPLSVMESINKNNLSIQDEKTKNILKFGVLNLSLNGIIKQKANSPIYRALHQPVRAFIYFQNTTSGKGRFFTLRFNNQLYRNLKNQKSKTHIQHNWRYTFQQ